MNYILESHVMNKSSVLMVGESGSGKSWLVNYFLKNILSPITSTHIVNSMVIGPDSTVENAQRVIEQPLEKKRKGLYAPPYQKRIVYFIDDLSMTLRDKYGQSAFLELLRTHFDYGQWYDQQTAEVKRVDDI